MRQVGELYEHVYVERGKKRGGKREEGGLDGWRLRCSRPSGVCLQIYFLPDSTLSPVPFSAFLVGDRFLIQRASVAQAASLRTLDRTRKRWNDISSSSSSSSEPQSSPEVGWAERRCNCRHKLKARWLHISSDARYTRVQRTSVCVMRVYANADVGGVERRLE